MAFVPQSTPITSETFGHKLGGFSVDEFRARVGKMRGLAMANMFVVQLPVGNFKRTGTGADRLGPGFDAQMLNVLCTSVELPGRNIDSTNRQYGLLNSAVANGRSVGEVVLNFHLTNDYYVRSYFEEWQRQIVQNKPPYKVNYYKNYVKPIRILQLRKGESFPIFSTDLGIDLKIPPEIANRIPDINPIELFGSGYGIGGIDIGDILNGGNLTVALFSQENVVYEIELIDAYPSIISPIALDNEPDGLSRMSVTLTYRNWNSTADFAANRKTIADRVGDLIDDAFDYVIDTGINLGKQVLGAIGF